MTLAAVLVDLARSRIGADYDWGAIAPKDDPDYEGPFDCAELPSWAVYQLTGGRIGWADPKALPRVANAFSGAWSRDARALPELGRPVRAGDQVLGGYRVALSIACATPGAVLVRSPAADGLHGHVALSSGAGATVEAYSTAKGVIASHSVGRRWDYGVLVPGFEYTIALGGYVEPKVYVVGGGGPTVSRIQAQLAAKGFPCAVTGRYDDATARVVADFQRSKHLVVDGECGPLTFAVLGISP